MSGLLLTLLKYYSQPTLKLNRTVKTQIAQREARERQREETGEKREKKKIIGCGAKDEQG